MNDYPNRPDHDDFWLLAECIQDLDSAADDKVGLQRILGGVDAESLTYTAMQKALRAEMAGKVNPLTGAKTPMGEAMLGALWLDGFAVGRLFERRRQERGER